MTKRTILGRWAAAALAGFLGTAGCSHSQTPISPAAQQQTVQQQVEQIQNNPSIPGPVKANLIARLHGPGSPPAVAPTSH